jgi:hypothetical protein
MSYRHHVGFTQATPRASPGQENHSAMTHSLAAGQAPRSAVLAALRVIETVHVTLLPEAGAWDTTFAGIIPVGQENDWYIHSAYDEWSGCEVYTLTHLPTES